MKQIKHRVMYSEKEGRIRAEYIQTQTIDLNKIKRQPDGSIVLTAGAFKVGDYEHLGYETPFRDVDYDAILIGRLTEQEAQKTLDSFEGLGLTEQHIWLHNTKERKEFSVGSVLNKAVFEKIDGEIVAMTRIVITDSDTIVKVETGKLQELSIGFEYLAKDVRGKIDNVDFLIEDVTLNHLALVEKGRAGKQARLYNHANQRGEKMAKVKVNGVEYDVDPAVANHIEKIETDSTAKVDRATYDAVLSDKTKLEAKLDVIGNQTKENDVIANATKLAKAHAEFSADLSKFGFKLEKGIGEYDADALMREVLTKAGHTIKDGADATYVQAMFDYAKNSVAQAEPQSPLQGLGFAKTEMTFSSGGFSETDQANTASNNLFFGKKGA
jgi:hypothetical protein